MKDVIAIPNPIHIYEALKEDILLLRIKPGELISENQLCERFGVSRTPVRGVLQRLAQANLVEIVPRKGTRVTRMDYGTIDQMIYQRVAVESMVLRDYIKICSPSDVEIVRKSWQDLSDCYRISQSKGDFRPEEFQEKDIKMHEIWFAKMQRLYLWDIIRKSESSYTRFCMLDMLECENYEDVIYEHRQMLEIIEEKKLDKIEEVIKNHLYGGVKRLGTMIFNEFHDFFLPESIYF